MIQPVKRDQRDQQRRKEYRAEWGVFSPGGVEPEPALPEIDDVRCYGVSAILQARPWCVAARARREFKVLPGAPHQRRAKAHWGAWTIEVPRKRRHPWVVLHEVAHILTDGDQHGPAYAGTMVCLVRDQLGVEVASKLAAAYDRMGVKR